MTFSRVSTEATQFYHDNVKGFLSSKVTFCVDYVTVNPLTTNVPIIWKPVS